MIQSTLDTSKLKLRLEQIRTNTRELKKPLLRAGLIVLKAAQDRIDAGGPGWAPNKTGTPLLHRTGRLLSSLTVNGEDNVDQVTDTTIVVGTNVQYATFLQNGTGIYGALPAGTVTKTGKQRAGGIPARRFLFIDDRQVDAISNQFAKYILAKIDNEGDSN